MSDRTLLLLLLAGMAVAFGFGIWAGLGYPGLYDRYEPGGKVDRRTPFEQLVDWLMGKLDRR